MKKILLMTVLAVVLGISTSNVVLGNFTSNTAPIFYNTGVDNNGNQLPGGSSDPHYELRQLTVGAYVGNSNWAPAVAMDTSITWPQWIKPADARWIYIADASNIGQDWGTYEFKTTFDLTGYNPSTAVLSGKWALDQYGSIYLNGSLITTLNDGNWNNYLTPFTINSGFVSGINTLTFVVRFPDGGDGIIVSGASLSAVPEPETIAYPAGGTYNSTLNVSLVDPLVDALSGTIWYTTDGSNPTTSSLRYTGPINISSGTTLKFFAIAGGMEEAVKTEVYTIEPTLSETLQAPGTPALLGQPITVTAKFVNGTGNAIQTISPDCFNTFFEVNDQQGNPLPPRCRVRAAYGIPNDVITIPAGSQFTVTCDLSEMYDPQVLIPGLYNVQATYSNYIQDPDIVNGICTSLPFPCYNLWAGGITSSQVSIDLVSTSFKISGGAYFYPENATYRASFSMNVTGPSSPSGSLNYYYTRTRMNFVSTGITAVSISGNTATISGTGTVNGVAGYTFTATVTTGTPANFSIVIKKSDGSTYYSAGPKNISGGSLAISQL